MLNTVFVSGLLSLVDISVICSGGFLCIRCICIKVKGGDIALNGMPISELRSGQ